MLKHTHTLLVAAALAGLSSLANEPARAQFVPPTNSVILDEEGKLEGMQGNILKFRDSKQDVWLLQALPQTTISITGEADASYLRPGMTVELMATIDSEGNFSEPIAEVNLIQAKGRTTIGLFDPADEKGKPVRNPEPGEYRVRGRILSIKDGELEVLAGRLKIGGKLAEDFKAILAVDNPSLAKVGDTMKVKAWYLDGGRPITALNRPGQAIAEEVSITLSEPPVVSKRGR